MNPVLETTVIVFRHGETDWNLKRRFQGHTDVALNATGKGQAKSLREILDHFRPQAILTSELGRAKETTLIANTRLQAPMIESDRLRECDLGDAEGLLFDEVIKKFGTAAIEQWHSANPDSINFGFPNGESKKEHAERLQKFLESFLESQPQLGCIAVSTHGGCIRRLLETCINPPSDVVMIPNCAAYHFTFDRSMKDWIFQATLTPI